jgi:hypothetical protein
MFITYVVFVPIVCVALNEYAKNILNRILMAKEGVPSNIHTSAHFSAEPFFIDFAERDSASTVDYIH